MRRREALKLLAGSAVANAAAPSRPNILFVISDDLNNDFGGLGRLSEIRTPHLDRLTARGVRFEHAYCQYPLCNPSRVSLFSGLRPATTQVLDNVTPPRYAVPDFVTLPQYLRGNGYKARYFGKVFHLLDPQSWNDHAPPPTREKVKQFNYWIEPVTDRHPEVATFLRGMMQPKTVEEEQLEDYKIANDAIGALREFHAAGDPFFLAVGFRRPHVPLVATQNAFGQYSADRVRLPEDFKPTPEWKDVPADAFRPNLDLFFETPATGVKARELVAAYYACVTIVDSQLGRVLDELERLDLSRNTIVVVVADHGWHLGQKGMWAKMTLFEHSANVPLLIVDPRKSTSAGRRSIATAESLDIYPTLVELCGLPVPRHVEGKSLAPLLDDPASRWDKSARTVMLRDGFLARSVRTPQWRYTEWDGGRRGVELYDHEHDPHEMRNLSGNAKYARVMARLKEELA